MTSTFFFNDTATTEIYTLSLHDALPILISSFQTNASGNDETPPTVVIANNFEEIKVTYTEFDDEGNKKGNVETSFKVEKGTK